MDSIYSSAMAHGTRLLASPSERAEYKKMALRHKNRLRQLCKAIAHKDEKRVAHLTSVILRSDATKVLAVARTIKWKPGDPPISLAYLKAKAAALDLYAPIAEAVRVLNAEKFGDRPRWVLDFGQLRRAGQIICADLLDVLLPVYEFDYLAKGKGADRATLRLKEIIETGKYEWVGVFDLTAAFGTVNKEKLAALLPLPAPVVNNVLLVKDDVVVELAKEVIASLVNLSLSTSTLIHSSADTVARKGLPQGGLASNLIMSRAVLCPLLNATPFVDRLVLYGDDTAVAAKSEAEAKDAECVLRSALENTPFGPLTIGRYTIRHRSQRNNFAKYGLRQDPWNPDGPMEACPSARSFERFGKRAEGKCLDGPMETAKGRVSRYRKAWPKAFPLWKPTEHSLGLLWQTAFEARQNAERRRK
jgi:hypothetical protein